MRPLPFDKSLLYLIAINQYDDKDIDDLFSPINDTSEIERILSAPPHSFLVRRPAENSHKGIIALLEGMRREVKSGDRILFYFAGHGITLDTENGKQEGYIIPKDGKPGAAGNNWISMSRLLEYINQLECIHALIVLDCCFAGSILWADYNYRDVRVPPRRVFKEHFDFFVKDKAWQVITSAAFDQTAKDVGLRNDPSRPLSPFVEALLRGLNGAADFNNISGLPDGIITATELAYFLRQELEQMANHANINHRQTPRLINLKLHDKGEYIFLNPLVPVLKLDSAVEATKKNNPFKGLLTYEEGDEEKFFGRDKVIQGIVSQLDIPGSRNSFMIVTGVSGSGKSSVVKAGVLPQLKKKGWKKLGVQGIIRPGEKPMDSIAVLPPADPNEKSYLVVDQLEEIVTLNKDKKVAEDFMSSLFVLYNGPARVCIIMTVRSDFESHIPKAEFRKIWHDCTYGIPWFSREELRDIIIRPAANIAFFYEPVTLIDRIVDDVLQYPGSLPMLSTLLSRLYLLSIERIAKERDYKRLLLQYDYEEIEGVSGALQNHLQAVAGNKKTNLKALRLVLLRMVDVEGGTYTKKSVNKDELTYGDESTDRLISDTIELLREERIITPVEGFEDTWEPVHDAVVRWEQLGHWIEEIGTARMAVQVELENDIKIYFENGEKKSDMWQNNDRLDGVYNEINETGIDQVNKPFEIKTGNRFPVNLREKDFIIESHEIKIKNKRRRRKEIVIGFVSLSVLLIVAIFFLFQSIASTKKAEKSAEDARTSEDTAVAARKRADDKATEAILALQQYEREKFGRLVQNGDIYMDARYYSNAILQYDSAKFIRNKFPDNDSTLNRIITKTNLDQKINQCNTKLGT